MTTIIRGVELVGEDSAAQEIVISGGMIARVSHPVAAEKQGDGRLLEFADAIAFPGLTNSHDHLEYNLYPPLGHKRYADCEEWSYDIHQRDARLISSLERVPRAGRLRWGALKNLLCGVTTVMHHGDAPDDRVALPIGTVRGTSIHSVRFAPRWRWQLNDPIDRSPYVIHLGEGSSSRARREIDTVLRWNLFRRPLVGVHAIAMRSDQAPFFRAVVWCPLSNDFLYGMTADIAALKRGTAILFGTDSTLTAEWNLWNHLRHARRLRLLDDRELYAAVTSTASFVWEQPNTGRLAPGQRADLVVARKKAQNRWDAFFAVNPEDILLVLRNGAAVMSDVSVDPSFFSGPFSLVRLLGTEKRVAQDVPAILADIERHGATPNLPVAVGSPANPARSRRALS